MRIYSKLGLIILFGSMISCSILKPIYSFDKVYYYTDLDKIKKAVHNPKGDFYFEKLLSKFLTDSLKLTKNESVAILFGASYHPGYNNTEHINLALKADSLLDIKEYRKAINTANKSLDIFPLSAKAIAVNWYVYSKLGINDTSDIYSNRLSSIFQGMQASGYSRDQNRPQIALSKNAIDEYCNKHAAGAGLKFEKEYPDAYGNKIVVYSAGFLKEIFIIPKRK